MKNALKGLVLAFILVAGASFNSQASASEAVGSAPIYMGDELKKRWDKYDNSFQRAYFLIRLENGRVTNAGHWHCGDSMGGECISETVKNFMWRVRKDNGQDWFLFAKYGKIVWIGPVCYNGQNLSKYGDCNNYNSSNQTSSSTSSNEPISDKTLCGNATDVDGGWEKKQYFKSYVDRAKARNLTLAKCAELTGRPIPNNSAASSSDSSKKMTDKKLCENATTAFGDWENKTYFNVYVNMAKARDLTIAKCAELTGRIDLSSKSSQSKTTICRNALSEDGMNWETGKIFLKDVFEAKSRGYTTRECAEINRRKEPSKATSNASQKEQLDSIEVRLKKLKKLEDAGLITDEEAAMKRKEILKSM